MDMNAPDWRQSELLIDENLMERMVRAVEKVHERLQRTTEALEAATIPYAVADGHAVATWIGRVDQSAVRNTPNVHIVLRRSDLDAAKAALSSAGFVHRIVKNTHVFSDGSSAHTRDAVHFILAGEKARPDDIRPAPDVSESERGAGFRVLALEPLVVMLLVSFRSKDRMHLRDMIDVGLVNESWLAGLVTPLSPRLKELLDNPEG
jgi:hypothetical protein